MVVIEVARADDGAGAVRDVLEANAPAVQVTARVIENGVQPQQCPQRPIAIATVAGRSVQPRKEQSGKRVGLSWLALLAVASAGVPPEATPEGRVPQTGALLLQEIGLALGSVDVAPQG